MNLGAQLGPLSITKLSRNWACQMGHIHFINFLLSGLSAELAGYKLDIAIFTETACHDTSIIVKDCSPCTEVLIGGDDRVPGLRRASWENYVRRHLALHRSLLGR